MYCLFFFFFKERDLAFRSIGYVIGYQFKDTHPEIGEMGLAPPIMHSNNRVLESFYDWSTCVIKLFKNQSKPKQLLLKKLVTHSLDFTKQVGNGHVAVCAQRFIKETPKFCFDFFL